MTDGSLTTFAVLPALLEPERSSSKTSRDYLPQTAGTLWPESVRRWPRRVSADGSGRLYERQTSEPATDANGGSVLLRTPASSDSHPAVDTRNPHRRIAMRKQLSTSGPRNTITDLRMVLELLPTPTANDYKNAGYQKGQNGKTFPTLPGAVGSAHTMPLSSGGRPFSDDPHPTPSPTDASTPGSSNG